ncbi:MAG: hypothetical protein ACLQBQ_12260 [Smithella sp.]
MLLSLNPVFYTNSKSKMILRRLGVGDETYVICAIMAQITGKEMIYLYCVPFGDTPVFTYVEEADNDANKNSALIGSAFPLGMRIMDRILHCQEFSPKMANNSFRIGINQFL